jgi:hypothetical protein
LIALATSLVTSAAARADVIIVTGKATEARSLTITLYNNADPPKGYPITITLTQNQVSAGAVAKATAIVTAITDAHNGIYPGYDTKKGQTPPPFSAQQNPGRGGLGLDASLNC